MDNNKNSGSNKVVNAADKLFKSKDKNKKEPQTSREKVDNALDSLGSEALQKTGVPKGISDKAIKKNGGTFSPGNLPGNKLIKNKSRNALAKGLDKFGGGNNPSPNQNKKGQNFGRNLLNGMRGNAQPQDEEALKRQKRLNRAIKIAKHVPIPQVKAAAQVADKVNKSGLGNSLMGKKGGGLLGGDKKSPFEFSGFINKRKLLMIAVPSLFFIIIFTSVVVANNSSSAGASAKNINDGLCVVDYVKDEKCEKDDNNEQFFEDIKSVKKEFAEEGKNFNPLYIIGVYTALSMEDGSDVDYDTFTKTKIEEIANAMFKEDDGTYTFDEKTFRKNLKTKILPEYINKDDYESMIDEVFSFVTRFEEIYGKAEEDSYTYDSDAANRLVQVAKEQLKASNPDRNKPHGNKYQKFLGLTFPNDAWCAAFVSWCADKAGIPQSVIPHYPAVNSFYNYYVTNGHGVWHSSNSGYKPKPGDLVIWHNYNNPANLSHIGIVEKYQNGLVTTIEGNTGYDPSARVGSHTVTIARLGCNGFVTPKYPAGTTTKLKGSNNAQKAWNFFRDKKVSKETTAAILGNLYHESGIDPNSHQYNGGPGRGIAQWTVNEGRYNQLVNMANSRNKSWNSLDVQLDFLWYELKGGESTTKIILNRDYGGFNHFIKAHNIPWAVKAFERSYERAGIRAWDSRTSAAYTYYKMYGGKK